MSGKGDRKREVDEKKFGEELERLFGKKCRFPHKHDETCDETPPPTTDK